MKREHSTNRFFLLLDHRNSLSATQHQSINKYVHITEMKATVSC